VFPLEFAAFNDYANNYLTEMLNKAGGHGRGMTMMMVDVNDLEKILGGH
jgi:GGDEF domain-containing protein